MWITDFILNPTITYKMEKTPKTAAWESEWDLDSDVTSYISTQYVKRNICDQKQNKTHRASLDWLYPGTQNYLIKAKKKIVISVVETL